ncbi:MAG: hypothetical protein ACOYXB_03040 [Bacteroidota bacterium]
MKVKISTRIFIFPLVACLAISCDKIGNLDNEIALEYIKCSCEYGRTFFGEISADTILLFNASKTSYEDMITISSKNGISEFVAFYTDSSTTKYYKIMGEVTNVGFICNFPDIIEEWNINKNGKYISFSADCYQTCHEVIIVGFYAYMDLVLTTLKI